MKRTTLLITSCKNGNLDLVRTLVSQGGVDLHFQDDLALRYAVDRGHVDIVKYLVEHGANILAQNGYCLARSLQLAEASKHMFWYLNPRTDHQIIYNFLYNKVTPLCSSSFFHSNKRT